MSVIAAGIRADDPMGAVMSETNPGDLKQTPLGDLHRELGARMVPFAGYDMPVQFEGIIAEHLHARNKAVLFDVSHMGQAILRGGDAIEALEALVPGSLLELPPNRMRYTLLTTESGGIIDDLMVTRRDDHLFLVVNAARKETDFEHLSSRLPDRCELEPLPGRALLALQGPKAVETLSTLAPDCAGLGFMSAASLTIDGIGCLVTRSGYTGEDGFEISVAAEEAEALAQRLLAHPDVKPAGLGARDSLRLEAGLCLYGSDIDETTTPVEAGLTWTIGKRRREQGGFLGSDVILRQLAEGPQRRRVGIRPEGRAPARAHTEIRAENGSVIGEVTSGSHGPSVGGPVAMGYVRTDHARPESPVHLMVRGRGLPGRIVKLPFVEHRYHKT